MSLIDYNFTAPAKKLNQCEIVTKCYVIKLQKDGSRFIDWKEEMTNHYKEMGFNSILKLGINIVDAPIMLLIFVLPKKMSSVLTEYLL